LIEIRDSADGRAESPSRARDQDPTRAGYNVEGVSRLAVETCRLGETEERGRVVSRLR